MASVTFDQFLPEVLTEAPGVPYPVAINAVRNACFDFCRQTLVWNEFQDAEAYVEASAEYSVSPPSGAQVIQVLNITLDGTRTIYPTTSDVIVAARPQWRTDTGAVECFVCSSPDTFRFVAVPNSSGTYVAEVAYAPSRTATTADASLFNLYLEAIKHGALWKLKSMVSQPWSDATAASYHNGLFLQAIGKATSERTRNNSRAALRVASQWFA